MKTNASLLRHLTVAAAICIASISTVAFSQTTASTVPVGFFTINVPAAADATTPSNTTFCVPIYNTPDFISAVATVDTTTAFTLTGATWTDGQFATAAAPRFVRVKSSATASHVGKFFLVTANTTNQLTVALPAGTTDIASAVSAGDSCEVVPASTLSTLFGTNAAGATSVFATGTFFQTGASAGAADSLLVWDPTATPSPTWVTFYNNNTNWKKTGSLANQNNTVIYPDEGIFVIRRATSALPLTFQGTVPSTAEQTDLTGNGSTFISGRFPVDTTFLATGIHLTANWVNGASASAADNVFVWNPLASPSPTWDTYYYNGSNWKKSGSLANQNTTVILAGTPMFVTKNGAAATLTQALPYVP